MLTAASRRMCPETQMWSPHINTHTKSLQFKKRRETTQEPVISSWATRRNTENKKTAYISLHARLHYAGHKAIWLEEAKNETNNLCVRRGKRICSGGKTSSPGDEGTECHSPGMKALNVTVQGMKGLNVTVQGRKHWMSQSRDEGTEYHSPGMKALNVTVQG